MKKVLLIILVTLIGIASLGSAGFVGFQMGVHHAVAFQPDDEKTFKQFHRFGKDGNPMPGFHQFGDNEFEQRIGPGGGPGRMHRGGFGFISPFFILAKLAFLGLFVWLGYNLFKGNGWQLTLSRVQPNAEPAQSTPPPKPKKVKQ